jgi:hypothetical protein
VTQLRLVPLWLKQGGVLGRMMSEEPSLIKSEVYTMATATAVGGEADGPATEVAAVAVAVSRAGCSLAGIVMGSPYFMCMRSGVRCVSVSYRGGGG